MILMATFTYVLVNVKTSFVDALYNLCVPLRKTLRTSALKKHITPIIRIRYKAPLSNGALHFVNTPYGLK